MALTAADYYIHSLPGLASNITVKQYAGHIPLDDWAGSRLFFWLITRQEFQTKERLVIWFNGGPGCMDGLFMENGPYRPRADLQLDINPYSWHTYANILFVDQPVGTGFSYMENGDGVHDMLSAGKAMRIFLEKFLNVFPEYKQSEVYLAGESYAGVYIPYIAKEIIDANEHTNATSKQINLAGLAFGNGWVDGYMHYMTYVEFAEQYNLLQGDTLEKAKNLTKECDLDYKLHGERIKYDSCDKIFNVILETSIHVDKSGNKTCLNVYDKRLRDPYPECGMAWPPILPHVYAYLKRKDVVKAIHAENKTTEWTECDPQVATSLEKDKSLSSHLFLPDLLKKVKVLFFNGDEDTLCNRVGTERTIERLTWNGQKGFQNAPQKWWNLTYARIFNGSHMVSVDKARETFDMINRLWDTRDPQSVHKNGKGMGLA
ncbi:Alpha/Beta hydrolase protein [Syncephalis plumigaleata]|nr:Alpha/Beta hydrolase protein [Syncephalis plumigaleata]